MGTWRQRTLLRSEGVVCPGPPRCQLLQDTDLSPFSRSSPLKVSSTQKDNIVYSSYQPLPDRTLLRGPSRLNPRIEERNGYFIGLGSPKEPAVAPIGPASPMSTSALYNLWDSSPSHCLDILWPVALAFKNRETGPLRKVKQLDLVPHRLAAPYSLPL